MERFGLVPSQIPDFKGMMGDPSDHIPGIPGVGEKTALKLMAQFGSMENMYAHTEEITGKLRDKIEAGRELAFFSKDLATIDRAIPLEVTPEDCALTPWQDTELGAALEELEFHSLQRRVLPPEVPGEPVWRETEIPDLEAAEALIASLTDAPAALHMGEALTFAQKGSDTVYVFPLLKDLLSGGWTPEDALAALSPALSRLPLTVHQGKTLLHRMARLSLPLPAIAFDTELAAYLLDASASQYDPEKLYQKAFPSPLPLHAGRLLLLAEKQQETLRAQGQWDLFAQIELPLLPVLFSMEQTGFIVDKNELRRQGAEMKRRIDELEEEICLLSGERFNIQSPKQLGEVLFGKLRLPAGRKTKTGYSTSADILEQLEDQYPIVRLILEYRQLTKLMGTYIEGLQALIDPVTRRIHTRFNQTLTATGRLSSAEPNLQNIPVRMPEGRQIRRAFVADEGCVLVDADYSQIELRILAHMAQDEGLTQAFRAGEDIHAHTASQVFGLPQDQVPAELRSAAKAVNFGIIYGISDFGLARQLNITRKQAGDYIRQYLSTYSKVEDYMKTVVEDGRRMGYVETLYGRRRLMPELKSRDYNQRSAAERMAMNAPIQGTAADIMKIAMIAVDRELRRRNLRTRMILQVHDELILEAPEEEAEEAGAVLRGCMMQAADLAVPLNVEVSCGKSWYEAK